MSNVPEFEFEAELDAPPEDVWRALVDPEALCGWFATEARIDPMVGGEYHVEHGPEYVETAVIEALVPHELLRTSAGGRSVEYRLEGRSGATVLRIVQFGFGDAGGAVERGWSAYIQTLRHYLAHHAGEPAASAYVYASGETGVAEARRALPGSVPAGADVVEETERSIGARVPELGDGIHRALVEGRDGNVFVWVHLVAYGDGRARLGEVAAGVRERLEAALQEIGAGTL